MKCIKKKKCTSFYNRLLLNCSIDNLKLYYSICATYTIKTIKTIFYYDKTVGGACNVQQ